MNVIHSNGSSSCNSGGGGQLNASSGGGVVVGGLRTRTVSTMSGSLFGNSDNDRLMMDEEMAVIAAPPEELAMNSVAAEDMAPAEIPPEPSGTEYADNCQDGEDNGDDDNSNNNNNHHRDRSSQQHQDHHHRDSNNNDCSNVNEEVNVDDDESEYEYEDDDDVAFSGFLMTGQPLLQSATNTAPQRAATEPACIREDDEEEVETGAGLMDKEDEVEQPSSLSDDLATAATAPRKSKWREPSRDAVNMSLRAERETTGGKRRLAQDLYRIMNQDTEEAGFSLQPKSEDAMDKWCIKLFQFDEDSNLAKDMMVLGLDHVELEMSFPEHYPFEPPFVRVVRPRFKRQTGFVMNGALCMELLTKDGWNPINDIESVIVSIRSLLVVGDGRLQAACDMPKSKYESLLATAKKVGLPPSAVAAAAAAADDDANKDAATRKRQRSLSGEQLLVGDAGKKGGSDKSNNETNKKPEDYKRPSPLSNTSTNAEGYSMADALAAYSHLSDYHARKGWDNSGWWTRQG